MNDLNSPPTKIDIPENIATCTMHNRNHEQYYKQVTGCVLEAFYKPFNNEQVQEHINYSVSQFNLF